MIKSKKNIMQLNSISFGLVNYFTRNILKNIFEPLDKYGKKNNIKLNFFLFNNSIEENLETLIGNYSSINLKIYNSTKNIGYAAAIYKIINEVSSDYIFFCNPDCKFGVEQIEEFITKLNKYSNSFGAAVCDISTGKKNHPFFSGIATVKEDWTIGYNKNDCGWKFACGAFILYHIATLKKIGSIDKNYIMYFEDTDISLRLQINGYKLISVSLKNPIQHFVGYTSNTFFKKLKAKYYFYKNLIKLKKRFKKFQVITNIDYI